jgi:non-heme chloroperoxidase
MVQSTIKRPLGQDRLRRSDTWPTPSVYNCCTPQGIRLNMKNSIVLLTVALVMLIFIVALAIAIAFGGPKPPPPMASINNPFKSVDFSGLPALLHFTAEDGASLAYRYYVPKNATVRGSVVLVHGSSASSNSMHVLALGFAEAGYAVYALDIRGHGSSGTKGSIQYVGQLEDDLDSFMHAVSPAKPSTLVGFSSGGGFVLRFAGSSRQDEFENYLLLSPFLSQDAPNYRPNSGGWVNVGVARVVALSMLNAIGIHAFNDLPVTSFALSQEAKSFLTPEYSFALAVNFRPQRDYQANIRAVHQPCAVVAGTSDEAFLTNTLLTIFRDQGKNWPVTLVPGVGHIALTLDPVAVRTAVGAVESMRAGAT